MMSDISRNLIFIGVVLIVFGLGLSLLGRIPGLGKLPGDILVKKENFTFYFPLATSLLISLILSLLLFLWNRK